MIVPLSHICMEIGNWEHVFYIVLITTSLMIKPKLAYIPAHSNGNILGISVLSNVLIFVKISLLTHFILSILGPANLHALMDTLQITKLQHVLKDAQI